MTITVSQNNSLPADTLSAVTTSDSLAGGSTNPFFTVTVLAVLVVWSVAMITGKRLVAFSVAGVAFVMFACLMLLGGFGGQG